MPRSPRFGIIVLLVLLLLPAALEAAGTRQSAEPIRSRSAVLAAWDALARMWTALTGAQNDNGCRMDPNGNCLPGQGAALASDNGCWIDPSGRCLN